MTHICVGKLTLIGSDNGLSPGRRQAIIWTNSGLLLIRHLGVNFNEIQIGIQTFSLKKNAFENVVCKMASILPRPQCVNTTQASNMSGYVHLVIDAAVCLPLTTYMYMI